jgi:hypothetical protein
MHPTTKFVGESFFSKAALLRKDFQKVTRQASGAGDPEFESLLPDHFLLCPTNRR